MSAQPTPGPWRQLVTRIDDARGYQICHIDLHGKSEAERDANRRLIAAAPELLAMVQRLLAESLADSMGTPSTLALADAKDLIARATGAQS